MLVVLMVLPLGAHVVHRGHGVFDTAAVVQGVAYQLEPHLVRPLRSAELAPDERRAWQSLLDNLIREALPEIVLHRFQPGDLALADALGVEPERIEVTADGLVVWFAPRGRR